MGESIIVAIITGIFALIGTYLANSKHSVLIAYRLEQLEKKVEKHNNVVERVFRLEDSDKLLDEKIKVANHRIEDLEKSLA